MAKLSVINSRNLNSLILLANEKNIQKEDIVQIIKVSEDSYSMVYRIVEQSNNKDNGK